MQTYFDKAGLTCHLSIDARVEKDIDEKDIQSKITRAKVRELLLLVSVGVVNACGVHACLHSEQEHARQGDVSFCSL